MATSTTTFTLTVTAPATTVLGDIVAELTAEFGTAAAWSNELTDTTKRYLVDSHPLRDPSTPKINDLIDSWGGVEPLTGSRRTLQAYNTSNMSTQILAGAAGPYAASGWDSQTGMWHVAGTTGSNAYSQTIANYNPATDGIKHWQGSSEGDNSSALWPLGGAHNFGSSALDLKGRKIYRLLSNSAQNGGQMAWAYIDDLRAGLDRANARRGINTTDALGCYLDPMIHFPDAGAAGQIFVMNWSRNSTPVWPCFDCATDQWVPANDFAPPLPMAALPVRAYYDGYNYIAANLPGNIFWRVDAAGNFTEMAPTPVPMNGWSYVQYVFSGGTEWDGQYNLFNAQFVAMNGSIYSFFPGDQSVAGYYGAVYRYDIAGDYWEGPIDQLPQQAIGVPFSTPGAGYTAIFVAYSVCAVPELNCVIFMQNRGGLVNPSTSDVAVVWKPPA